MERKFYNLVLCVKRLSNTGFSELLYNFHLEIISDLQKFTKLLQRIPMYSSPSFPQY